MSCKAFTKFKIISNEKGPVLNHLQMHEEVKTVPFYILIPFKIALIPWLFNRPMFTHFSLQEIEGL